MGLIGYELEAMKSYLQSPARDLKDFNKEGIVDNVILRDPGGVGMFIFND